MSNKTSGDKSGIWSQIVVKAGNDPKFKMRLLAEPEAVVKEHGLDLPAGVRFSLIENPDKSFQLKFSDDGDSHELSLEDLALASGGTKADCTTTKVGGITYVDCNNSGEVIEGRRPKSSGGSIPFGW